MTYSEKLRNPKWQRKRLEILQRDNFKCCLCGDEETELHVHHLKYTGEPHEAPNKDLQTLCAHCHLIEEIYNKAGVKILSSYRLKNLLVIRPSTNKLCLIHINEENRMGNPIYISDTKLFLENITRLIEMEVPNG